MLLPCLRNPNSSSLPIKRSPISSASYLRPFVIWPQTSSPTLSCFSSLYTLCSSHRTLPDVPVIHPVFPSFALSEGACAVPSAGNAFPNICVCLIHTIFLNVFIFWLHWVFVAVHGLSLVAASRDHSSCGAWAFYCSGFFCFEAWALEAWASVAVVHGFGCPSACGIFLDQESNHISCR